MWVLVLITLQDTLVDARHMGAYETMDICFEKRADLMEAYSASTVHFPADMQAICIRTSESQ